MRLNVEFVVLNRFLKSYPAITAGCFLLSFVIPWLDHGTQVSPIIYFRTIACFFYASPALQEKAPSSHPSFVIPWLDHGIQVSPIIYFRTIVRYNKVPPPRYEKLLNFKKNCQTIKNTFFMVFLLVRTP